VLLEYILGVLWAAFFYPYLDLKPAAFMRLAHEAHFHRVRPLAIGTVLPPVTGFVMLQLVQNFIPNSSAIT
jgi:hypothetical protein